MDVGAVCGETIASYDNMLFFVGKSLDFVPGIFRIKGLEYERIDDITVSQWLATYRYPTNTLEGMLVRDHGNYYYVVSKFDSYGTGGANSATFVFDLAAKQWSQWTYDTHNYMPFRFTTDGNAHPVVALGATDTYYYNFRIGKNRDGTDIFTDEDEDGTKIDINSTLVTEPWDGGVSVMKFFHKTALIGVESNETTISVSWRDNEEVDSGDDAVFSTARSVYMQPHKNWLWRCGASSRRRFKLTWPSDHDAFVEIRAIDLTFSNGDSESIIG
jgi:hypothetical protein